jgi:hypothetical protein
VAPVEKEQTRTLQPRDRRYNQGGPAVNGVVTACFKDGMLFRVSSADHLYFYNDTIDFEMHVVIRFEASSDVQLPPDVHVNQDGQWSEATAVIFPAETIHLSTGSFNGYRSKYSARPLGEEYKEKVEKDNSIRIDPEINAMEQIQRQQVDVLEVCVSDKRPFVDLSFPPNSTSLSRVDDARHLAPVHWKRPGEFLAGRTARLFDGGVEPNDIDQGQLGDCWFLCSVASVAEFPGKIQDMFTHPVSIERAQQERACGAYCVTFNKHGLWHVVFTDDYLPCVGNIPCFAKNVQQPDELWVALLEKAYAKLNGSYAAITGGDALHALTDLTGYPTARFDSELETTEAARCAGVPLCLPVQVRG